MATESRERFLYTAVYNDVAAAKVDLGAVEEMHEAEMIGNYDAAVVDREDGTAHVVKRVDRAAYSASTEHLIKTFSPL